MEPSAKIRWAAKVKKAKIRRLYETEAQGIYDEELIEEVGMDLYLRCVSILEVTEAVRGRVKCHGCGAVILREVKADTIRCADCGWQVMWSTYQKSYQEKQLFGGAALPFFQNYVERFLHLQTPREKLLLIDRLIHEFHWYQKENQAVPHAVRPTAANLIEGNGIGEVVAFLEELTHGSAHSPEVAETSARWKGVVRSPQGTER